jgi:hypothetical protein
MVTTLLTSRRKEKPTDSHPQSMPYLHQASLGGGMWQSYHDHRVNSDGLVLQAYELE